MTWAIVLAAGRSTRMGTSKALLPFGASTVIVRIVDALLVPRVNQVIVVVNPGDSCLRSALAGQPVTFVENPAPAGDMLSSLRCALRLMPCSVRGVVVSTADQPSLKAELVTQMLDAFAASARGILVPVHNGRRGHPIIFASRYRDELLTAYEGVGLRGLLQAHPTEVLDWDTAESAVLEDIDTPSDYQGALRKLEES